MNRLMVFGHGSDDPGDELNSRASFERVRHLEIDGVELDVRRTRDDVVVASHDAHLPDGRAIRDTLHRDLPAEVVTLDDILTICDSLLVNIEVKNYPSDPDFDADQRVTALVLQLLAARANRDRVMISSFGMACLDYVRNRAPAVPTAVLFFRPADPDTILEDVVAHGHKIVHPYDPQVDERFMAAARTRDLTVNVWTITEDDKRTRELIDLGVDGIITGDPEAAIALRRAAGR
jgi:glycerophosphoryl diester phosphodiesterase